MIKRICLQESGFAERVYVDKEEMRLDLCSFHEFDWTGTEDIFTLTFQEICDYGDWGYEEVKEVTS